MKDSSTMIRYWDRRAPSYTDVIMKNLAGSWDEKWADMLISHFPKKRPSEIKVLDIGTGPGFYAIILASRGYDVTAVDFSENMLREARKNAGELARRIDFRCMDAQALELESDSFDVIVTRNLTWNLPDPVKAYRDWRRVLRPGGTALIFDANWYAYLRNDRKKSEFERDRRNTRVMKYEDYDNYEGSRDMEFIAYTLPMTDRDRPDWDIETLLSLGFSRAEADTNVFETVWSDEEKVNYASTPGFLIRAVK